MIVEPHSCPSISSLSTNHCHQKYLTNQLHMNMSKSSINQNDHLNTKENLMGDDDGGGEGGGNENENLELFS